VRYLVYILIAANLAVFAWYQKFPQQEPPAAKPAPLPASVAQLVLLSETASPPGKLTRTDEVAVPEQPAAGPEAGPPLAQSAPTPAETTKQQVPAEPPQVATAGVVEQDVTDESPQAALAGVEPADGVDIEPVCRTVGPLLDEADAAEVLELLSAQEYQVTLRDGKTRQPAGYWVYLPEMSVRDAQRVVADLEAHGMKDYYVGKKNHISLGIFSKQDKARVRQQTVQDLGYDALLDQRFRTRPAYWLNVREQGQPLPESEVWQKVLAQHADIAVELVDCE
jgi:hypothetical protein